ncbi:hypothetical protein LSTR_LSTR011985 [Laodelphax striatellus]|uniref:Nose resistant-to-fluoxetine protein N-terminal domain-containing protein n=1 Tax=Laodelphax striatellus TaxID=195883 RepID=A0A482WZY8_LAOST|nr:hypothetical protein LSTR_LSTR011985 [Laodelphax striatellus]
MYSVSGTIPEDLGGYQKIYESMASFKGETYSFVVNFLMSGIDSSDNVNALGEFGVGLANCVYDLKLFQKAYQKRETWALKMLDASTQLQSGFLQGNTVDLGNFDQCLAIDNRKNNITGQHCFIYYEVDGAGSLPTVTDLQHVLSGICVPSSCSHMNLIHLLMRSSMVNKETGLEPVISRCQTRESSNPRVGSLEAVILLSFGVLGALVLIGTVLDIYLRYNQSRPIKPQMPLLELESSSREFKACKHEKYERGLLAFSFLTNGKELFQLDTANKSIKCLYGLRFFSACFILSIHRMLFDPQPFSNIFAFETEMRKWYRSIQLNAYLFVDVFFVMSGLLLAYRYSSHIKKGEKLNLVHYYLHRYIRLTPPLLAVVMLDLLLGLLCDGPYCIQVLSRNRDRCIDNAVYTLTYLNNMVDSSRKCVAQSWYLSADMQIYALAPILFYFLKKYRRSVPYLLLLCLDHLRSLDGELIYYPFYTRMGPWLIGFALGLKLQNFNNHQYQHSKRLLTYGWIVAIFCILIAIFGVYPFNQIEFQHDRITDSLFKAFYRNLFGLGFAWLIYVCHTGHCNFLNRFLSTPVLQVLGKLSYSFFLIHPFVQFLQYRSVSEPRKYSDFLQGSILLGDIFYSLGFATVLHLAVEAPTLKLEKIFFENSKLGGANRTIVKKP